MIKETAFFHFIKPTTQVPIIGSTFQRLFPATLVVLTFINTFDLWSKFMRKIGLEDFTFTQVYDSQIKDDGKRLSQIGKLF